MKGLWKWNQIKNWYKLIKGKLPKMKIKSAKGFTLVELLVVMSILGVLATLIGGGFRTAQLRGRDAQRKSDLKEIANALAIFQSDHGTYPPGSSGFISGCPYDPLTGAGTACSWGAGHFTDGSTTYFSRMPDDPVNSLDYVYRIVPGSSNQKFQVFARLENIRDTHCLGGDCENPPVTISCGSANCNYALTSPNSNPLE